MKLIIGLGNNGAHFEGTRHNVGFKVFEALATANNLEWTHKDKFKADITEGTMAGEKVILAKPTTYYNLSGEAAAALKQFYKIDIADIAIVHDELDLPFGTVRARIGGSDAGNNGIKSIVTHIGEHVARVRVGVANEQRDVQDSADFVLSRFSKEEAEQLPGVLREAIKLINQFIDPNQKFEHTSVRISNT